MNKAKMRSGTNFAEDVLFNTIDRDEEEVASQILDAIKQALRQKQLERSNLERALASAMQAEYNPTHIDRLQAMLDAADKEIARLEDDKSQKLHEMEGIEHERDIAKLISERFLRADENLEHANYETKRRWLYFLGVKVYIYRQGDFDDGRGHRWRILPTGNGILQALTDELQGGAVGSITLESSTTSVKNEYPRYVEA